MGLCLKKIEQSISQMDDIYDANFGQWVRNEDNAKVVGTSLRKYIGTYKISDFITVVKWIVKDWTLKSIIFFSKRLIIDDLKNQPDSSYVVRVKIISGLVYTWNSIFISEFLLTSTKEFDEDFRASFLAAVLNVFETKKLGEILVQIEDKIDKNMQKKLILKFKGVYKCKKWNRTGSMLEAFNLI